MRIRHSVHVGILLALAAGGCRGIKTDLQTIPSEPPPTTGGFNLCSPEVDKCNLDNALKSPQCDANSSDPECGDPGNGRGIYNVYGGQYCLQAAGIDFCPMAFVNRGGQVLIAGIHRYQGTPWTKTSYAEIPLAARFNEGLVTLVSFIADKSRIQIQYKDISGVHGFPGAVPGTLRLSFIDRNATGDSVQFDLEISSPLAPQGGGSPIWKYDVRWRPPRQSATWTPLCRGVMAGSSSRASFLQGALFDPFVAARTEQTSAVTMSCEGGGITQCLEWGYLPWKSEVNAFTNPQTHELLGKAHVACIQMKRAAYCGGRSFTQDGTTIHWQHRYSDPAIVEHADELLVPLEALWTPAGATCINEKNRRAKGFSFPNCKQPLAACPAKGDGTAWWKTSWIASAPDVVAP